MRVLWLAPYPLDLFPPEIVFRRRAGSHSCSWIVQLSGELSRCEALELHIATAFPGITHTQSAKKKNGITFHAVRHAFPFTARGFPDYCRLDLFTRYVMLRKALASLIEAVKPDLIHVHGTEYGYGLAAAEAKVPTLVSIQGIMTRILEVEDSFTLRLQAGIEREVIRRATHFGTRTEWANEFVRSIHPDARIHRMQEAVNPVFFSTDGGRGKNRILFVGGVQKRKGIEVLCDALPEVVARYPDLLVQIVGGGKPRYLRYLMGRINRLGISPNISWLGGRSAGQIATLHAESSVLVQPTLVDNSPNTVAEAMASGLPVVASNVGGIPSMIEDGLTGVLVKPSDPDALAEALMTLLEGRALREKMASAARAVARERFLPSTVAEETVRVYRSILVEKPE